ncbi:MAG: PadR family transcriptional regulator [Nitrososphaerota archaeon]|nr:PadR family transcriptional regulator [Nitrososphaerota archaeon]
MVAVVLWPFRFAMTRRRKRGLPHMVMYLLSSSPMNGVELMDGVQSITRGWWRPTPGSIYPLMKEMLSQGLVRKLDDGRFELTEKGRYESGGPFGPASEVPMGLADALEQAHNALSYVQDLKRAGRGDVASHLERLREIKNQVSEILGEKAD